MSIWIWYLNYIGKWGWTLSTYPPEIEQEMKKFYQTLSEKDKRRYAAVEALKLGHGGITYVATVLGCCHNTIRTGIDELKHLPEDSGDNRRIRKPGGGRKPYDVTYPDIDKKFLAVVSQYTAGDPMDDTIRWTNLSPQEIAERLAQQHGIEVSVTVARQLLAKHGYRRRKIQKNNNENGSRS